MIAHVSMPANDCALVARVLAEMIGGSALPFPPGGPGAFNCWSQANDFQIVITPRGQVMLPGEDEQTWAARPRFAGDEACESHFAVAVERSADEIVELARGVGWRARICDRGDLFDAVEVWVENAYLVEMLDPRQFAAYQRSMTTDNWKRAFGLA